MRFARPVIGRYASANRHFISPRVSRGAPDQPCRSRRKMDELSVESDVTAKDCLVRFERGGRTLALASIFRDVANLRILRPRSRGHGTLGHF